jgi:Rrf2 family protein
VKISQSAEYALRAIVWLAAHPTQVLSTVAIAKGTRVPPGYLSKVLQGLSRAGLVQSSPGRSGGFVLARDPSRMTVYDVVNAVDPLQRLHSCPLGIASHGSKLCPLHRSLDQVAESAERAFRQTTIAHLLNADGDRPPLCDAKTHRARRRAARPAAPVQPVAVTVNRIVRKGNES